MDLTQELFQSIKLIVEHELSQQKTTSTIIGTVIEKVSSSEAYKVSYQNIEIIASSLGGIYSPGDSVYILLPNGVLGDVKFIVGKTNDRTPTVAKSGDGLSDSTMSMIQNIINSFTEWSSDNSISPIEKASLALQWETIKSSYAEALGQAREYPEVPVTALINKYDNLKKLVEPLLSNMGTTSSLNGEELRLALGEYLSEDSAVRLLVQEELKKELVYKTTIVSSEGNSFKNGIIDTTLSTISMRGRKNIDRELESNQIRWTKLDGDGSEEVGSETFGFTREVGPDDVHVKQIFKVEIIIGGIIVAQDYITLVDLNDIENIDLTITIGGSTKQIFNPDTNTIIPDYTKENQVMFARVFKGKEDLSQIADIKWFYNGTPIVSDGRFLVEGYKLTILRNLTNTENPVILIKCSASYYSSEYQMMLEDEEVTEFLLISNGSNAELLVLNVSTNVIKVDKDGNVESDMIEIVASIQNAVGDVVITATPYIGKTPQQQIELAGAGNSRFFDTSSWDTSWDSLVIQATLGELMDVQTIIPIFDGEDGTSNYNVVILSTEGDTFKNGLIGTTLVAKVYYGDQDVTDQIDANRFRWSRSSIDKVSDGIWNSKHFSGKKEVQITTEDVHKRATFSCDILGE